MELIHTIPVPRGWSPEQAWEAMRRNEHKKTFDTDDITWVNIRADDNGNLLKIYYKDEEDE